MKPKAFNDTLIVLFSTADWDNPFWTNKQHMAVHLAEVGFKIIYVESVGLRRPGANLSDARRIWGKLKKLFTPFRRVHRSIWVYTPFVIPFHQFLLVRILNRVIMQASLFALRSFLRARHVWVWTYYPTAVSFLGAISHEKLVYHSVDDLSAAPRFPVEQIVAAEKEILKRADHVFVTSPVLKAKYEQLASRPVHFFPNVADYEHFRRALDGSAEIPRDVSEISNPRIGFIGAISGYKVDFQLLSEMARQRPSWNFVLIGKVGEGDPDTDISLLNQPNIHLLGPRSYSSLPTYLKSFDVCIIPCVLNDYTRSMFPMKFFEYMAAEKPVVASPLPSLQDYRDLYWEADGATEFIQNIEEVLQRPQARVELQKKAAQAHTWQNRLEQMLNVIEEEE